MHAFDNRALNKRFIISILLTSLILVAEVIGGIISGSLALLSDAAHVFSDIFALGLSFFALRLATRPPDDRHSYGWHRAEVLAALVNGVSLLVIAIGIAVEAWKRWQAPTQVRSTEMMIIAIIGLVVNLVVAFLLGAHDHDHGESRVKTNLNVRSAFLHVVGDSISSLGVIVAALLIKLTAKTWIDPLVSVLIAVLILVSAYRVLRSSLHILVEGVPEGLSVSRIRAAISQLPEVESVHDLHVWSLSSEQVSLSAHVMLTRSAAESRAEALEAIRAVLGEEFDIHHTTIQFEETACENGCGGCC